MHPVRYTLALATSCVALYIYSVAVASVLSRDPSSVVAQSYGGHFQYLTILSIGASLLHQLFSVLALITKLRFFAALQSYLLMVSAPLETVVALMYWPIKLSNPGLLKDKRIAVDIPPSLDRYLHLYPAVFELLSSTVFAQRRWRQGIVAPLLLFAVVGNAYWLWVEITFSKNGFYPYPLLMVLSTQGKALLICGASLAGFVTFKVIQAVQRATNA